MSKIAQLKITGQVQGVGLRYIILHYAQEKNLKGWVRNEPNGSVICCLQNDVSEIDEFINWLRKKINGISDINTIWQEMEGDFEDFIIKY